MCAATKKQKSQNIFRQFLCCFRPSNATVQQQSVPLPTTPSDENGSAPKVCKLFLVKYWSSIYKEFSVHSIHNVVDHGVLQTCEKLAGRMHCGALGRVTRVIYHCIILRVFCYLLSISNDDLFCDVSVVVQRHSWRVDYMYSLSYFSAIDRLLQRWISLQS